MFVVLSSVLNLSSANRFTPYDLGVQNLHETALTKKHYYILILLLHANLVKQGTDLLNANTIFTLFGALQFYIEKHKSICCLKKVTFNSNRSVWMLVCQAQIAVPPSTFPPSSQEAEILRIAALWKIHDLIFGVYCQENMWNSTTTNVVLFHVRQMNCFELWQRNRRFLSVFSARSAFCFGLQTRLSEIVSHQPFSNGQFLRISCGQ